MIDRHFVILGAVIQLFGSGSYVLATLKGKTRPNRISWFLWALAPLIAFFAELDKGIGLISLLTFMVGFGPAMILIASFVNRRSYWKITSFDYFCGAVSILGLILWWILREGNVAIAASIFADAMASIPTIRKAISHPETESPWAFFASAIASTITILAIRDWSTASAGFPIYILIVCIILFTLVYFKPFKRVELE